MLEEKEDLLRRLCLQRVQGLSPEVDWWAMDDASGREFTEILFRNRLLAWAAQDPRFPSAWLPAPDLLEQVMLRTARKLRSSEVLLKHCAKSSIEVLLLRGVFDAVRLFGEPFSRRAADVDAWVHPRNRDRSLQVLLEAGYGLRDAQTPLWYTRRNHYHWALIDPEGEFVDVHWSMHHRFSGFRIDADAIFREAEDVGWEPYRWSTLSPRHGLLVACTHWMRECPDFPHWQELKDWAEANRLEALVELAARFRRVEVDETLWRLAKEWRVEYALASGIAALRVLDEGLLQDEVECREEALQLHGNWCRGDAVHRARQQEPMRSWIGRKSLLGVWSRIGFPYFRSHPVFHREWRAGGHRLRAVFVLTVALLEYALLKMVCLIRQRF